MMDELIGGKWVRSLRVGTCGNSPCCFGACAAWSVASHAEVWLVPLYMHDWFLQERRLDMTQICSSIYAQGRRRGKAKVKKILAEEHTHMHLLKAAEHAAVIVDDKQDTLTCCNG